MIEMRRKLAVERCEREDANLDCFRNSKSKEDMQLALDWMNLADELIHIEAEIKDMSTRLVEIEKVHSINIKTALESAKLQKDVADAKIIAKRKSMNSKIPERNLESIDLSDVVEVGDKNHILQRLQ